MLPLDLLRTESRRGRITPLFCSADPSGADARVASALIDAFAAAEAEAAAAAASASGVDAGGGRRAGAGTRGALAGAAAELERGHDHRLVRGLFAVLERRAEFAAPRHAVAPQTARRRVFEESAARGLALSDGDRASIVGAVAGSMGIGAADLEDAMWGDSEERMLVRRFRRTGAAELAVLYNRSLAQTLLFRCSSMEVRIRGGAHWKRVLREVKRRRLMYVLEPARGPGGEPRAEVASCRIEGPTSLFRMTDRYGTAMARVLPAVMAAPGWEVSGTIVRHVDDAGGARLYRFALSDGAHGALLRPPGGGDAGAGAPAPEPYDSSVEERFAAAFESHFGLRGEAEAEAEEEEGEGGRRGAGASDHLGWRLVREPDPLIAAGRAMIPDFAFERFGRRVYLEIVGFWTSDYLRKKSEKVAALLGGSGGAPPADLLVAVDSSLACSQGVLDPRRAAAGRGGGSSGASTSASAAARIFAFSGDVPLKPVLARLAEVDAEIIGERVEAAAGAGGSGGGGGSGDAADAADAAAALAGEGGPAGGLVDAQEFAARIAAPVEAAVRILGGRLPGHVLVAGRYYISAEKAAEVAGAVGDGGRLADVCGILDGHGIPASCHGDMLSAIGYDVAWRDLDPAHASVARRGGGPGAGGGGGSGARGAGGA